MVIEQDGKGRVIFAAPQQRWRQGRVELDPELLQVASFAGQEMMAVKEEDVFSLHFLGLQTCGFKTMEEAKKAAPEFARKVLARLSQMIAD